MAKDNRSFFQRLTGAVDVDDEYEYDDFDAPEAQEVPHHDSPTLAQPDEEESDGQLSVDVFQKPDEIVIKAVVAGVKPDQLDVSITRDMVTIHGRREEEREAEGEDYFYQELYWGGFSRTILLPQEIDVEEALATEKHGILTIRLPKIDKDRQTKLKVKGG